MNTDKNKTDKNKTRLRYNWQEIWATLGAVAVTSGFTVWFLLAMASR